MFTGGLNDFLRSGTISQEHVNYPLVLCSHVETFDMLKRSTHSSKASLKKSFVVSEVEVGRTSLGAAPPGNFQRKLPEKGRNQ